MAILKMLQWHSFSSTAAPLYCFSVDTHSGDGRGSHITVLNPPSQEPIARSTEGFFHVASAVYRGEVGTATSLRGVDFSCPLEM